MFGRLFQKRNQPLDFADRFFVGVFRLGVFVQDRIHQNGQRLGYAIENQ